MKTKKIELDQIRNHFPSLKRKVRNKEIIFFDGPGGTQMPSRVISAISNYYRYYNANTHGHFQASLHTDHIIQAARNNIAALLGAEDPETISIGQNMTSLNYALSRGIGRILKPGDEILITQLDHEANRGPWLTLKENGIKVREVQLLPEGVLDYADLERKINENTRVVAVGWASNALGTVNDIKKIRTLTYKSGAWLIVDAVHYVPHFPVDVTSCGIDLLLCSSYKFYGPHLGFLYARPGILDRIPVDRLRTQVQHAPYRIETGTLNHAALAGVNAAVAFIAGLGEGKKTREKIVSGMKKVNSHEQNLGKKLYNALSEIDDIKLIGPAYHDELRAPTLSFIHKKASPQKISKILSDHGIAAWDGHFYAIRAMEVLGLQESGGVTRTGISMYNNEKDIDSLIKVLKKIK